MTQISDSLSIRAGELWIEERSACELLATFGSPLFVVSETHLRTNLRRYKKAFEDAWTMGPVSVIPAIKASPIIAVRSILSDEGCGCDVFGPGELECALRGNVKPEEISVNGSIKDAYIIGRAIDIGARIVLDSPRELDICEQEARKRGTVARVMFRIKPFMEAIETRSDFLPELEVRELTQMIKYGTPTSEVLLMAPRAMASEFINPIGIHVHMGRHSKHLDVWRNWVRECVSLTRRLSDAMDGWTPSIIDVGGGFPSFPDRDTDVAVQGYFGPSLEEYARCIADSLLSSLQGAGMDPTGITLEIEPGRGLHTDTGVHLTTVRNTKEETEHRPRHWIELDTSEVFLGISGFNASPPFDLVFASRADETLNHVADLVGQTCNAEMLFMQVPTPKLKPGDVIALLNTGAYIEPMAANFNALPRPGTVLVCGDQADMVRRHESVDDVFKRDQIPDRFLANSERVRTA